MYKSGGENVYPAEVELVLINAPDIEDLAVVGVPDETWGEVGLAVVVPTADHSPTLESLREFGSARLARYKLPQHLVLVDELARNVTGKVSRQELRDRFAQSVSTDTLTPPERTTMELAIDPARCTGNGRCVMVSMELFDLNDEGHGVVLEAEPGTEYADDIELAVQSCPERAISYR
jgi:ferredoxin